MKEIGALSKLKKDIIQWACICLCNVGLGGQTVAEIASGSVKEEYAGQYSLAVTIANNSRSSATYKWHKESNNYIWLLDSETEYKLFSLFVRSASVHNIVAASQSILCEVLNVGKPEVVKKAISGLTEKGLIVPVSIQKRGQPTKYMVNPDIRVQGNVDENALRKKFYSLISCEAEEAFTKLSKKVLITECKQKNVYCDYEDIDTMIYNVLGTKENDKKKGGKNHDDERKD